MWEVPVVMLVFQAPDDGSTEPSAARASRGHATMKSGPTHLKLAEQEGPSVNTYQLSGVRRLVVIGIPIAFAVLLLFHPAADGQVYNALHHHTTRWQIVHVGLLLFIGLMAIAIYLLIDGLDGRRATISRAALLPFVLFYGAFESFTGIGTGELVRHAHDLPPADQVIAGELIQSLLSGLGTLSGVVAVIAAALALRQAGAPRSVPILLGLAAVAFFVDHGPPTGPAGLVLFAVAAWRLDGHVFPLVKAETRRTAPHTPIA
jgi:hypothetical protein